MGSEWRQFSLGESGRIITGKTPPSSTPGMFGDHLPFVTPTDMDGGKWIRQTARSLSKAGEEAMQKIVLPQKSVIVSCIGSDMGKAALTATACVTNQQINGIVVDKSRFDPDFLYYNLSQRKAEIRRMAGGSAQPILNKSHFSEITFEAPILDLQREIVAPLTALDNKITLLRETNTTLEAIAQAIFKSWFVDFDPVRGKAEGRDPEGMPPEVADLFPCEFEDSELGAIPKGWQVQQLGLHIEVLETGRRPKGGVGDLQDGVPSIGAESIIRIGQFDYAKTKYVSSNFFQTMKTGKLESRDVLLYKDGGKPGIFLPRISMFGDGFPFKVCGINEHVFRIRTRETLSQPFLYFWLWSDVAMHELKHRGGKAAIPGINQSDVREVPVVVPSKPILEQFSRITDSLITKIFANASQIQSLCEVRDTLLPRLMSGKLRILVVEEALT